MRRRDLLASLSATGIMSMLPTNATSSSPPIRRLFNGAGGNVAVGLFPEFGQGEFVFDYARNRVGKIANTGKNLVMLPSLDGTGAPVATLTIQGGGLQIDSVRTAEIPIERRPFIAANKDVRLDAEIACRKDRPPVGTIILIYGSGPAPKEAFDFWALHFLAEGWAVVTYDKRGSGRSTGDWQLANLETLAADARAVIAACPHAPRPLGAWGASQAGWIMPQLAAAGAIDFIVMHAGAATTPGQQILDSVEAELIAYGFPREEIDRAIAYYKLDTDVSRGVKPWSAIDKAYKDAVAAKVEWILAPPEPAAAPARTFIRLVADFDPAPYWRQTKVPVLALFGSKDIIVPPAGNRALLHSLIPRTTPLQEHVLENANHLFMIADKGVRAEYPKRTAIHPDYFRTIDDWLKRPTPSR